MPDESKPKRSRTVSQATKDERAIRAVSAAKTKLDEAKAIQQKSAARDEKRVKDAEAALEAARKNAAEALKRLGLA